MLLIWIIFVEIERDKIGKIIKNASFVDKSTHNETSNKHITILTKEEKLNQINELLSIPIVCQIIKNMTLMIGFDWTYSSC